MLYQSMPLYICKQLTTNASKQSTGLHTSKHNMKNFGALAIIGGWRGGSAPLSSDSNILCLLRQVYRIAIRNEIKLVGDGETSTPLYQDDQYFWPCELGICI